MPLNVRRILKWVRMLESGEFQQTTSTLCRVTASADGNGLALTHCCLGVACELYSAQVAGFWDNEHSSTPPFVADFGTRNRWHANGMDWAFEPVDDNGIMPPPVAQWFGLTKDQQSTLTRLNDGGATFLEIAAYIRAHLKTKTWEVPDKYRD